MDKIKLKTNILLITYAILLFISIQHIDIVSNIFETIIALLIPFIYGAVIAYLLNRPYNFFRDKVFTFQLQHKHKIFSSLKQVFCLVSVYSSLFMILFLIMSLLVPELSKSIEVFIEEIPGHYQSLKAFTEEIIAQFRLDTSFWKELEKLTLTIFQSSIQFIYHSMPNIFNSIVSITSGITNIIFGFIISIYILSNKTKLCRQAKQLTVAFLPEKVAQKIIYTTHIAHDIFSNFINGQIIDAFILGLLCFTGMTLLGMPYALLVSVIIGLSNIVPIVGPILGAVPTTFIILMADPTNWMQPIWFIIFIIIIQQIDGDIIYPRVVGNSIGLSGLWVMFAILVGGGQFGILGMLIGVPTFAVVYRLLKESTYKRLQRKKNI